MVQFYGVVELNSASSVASPVAPMMNLVVSALGFLTVPLVAVHWWNTYPDAGVALISSTAPSLTKVPEGIGVGVVVPLSYVTVTVPPVGEAV